MSGKIQIFKRKVTPTGQGDIRHVKYVDTVEQARAECSEYNSTQARKRKMGPLGRRTWGTYMEFRSVAQ